MNSLIAFKVVENKITPRRALALALSFIFLILPMARAVDDIVIGPDGIPGIDGMPDPIMGGDGTDGGNGGNASANAVSADTSNNATATGGNGGNGGNGGDGGIIGGNGGDGGDGGDASAIASTTTSAADATATAIATGGNGGAGGAAGTGGSADGVPGVGGDGGAANANSNVFRCRWLGGIEFTSSRRPGRFWGRWRQRWFRYLDCKRLWERNGQCEQFCDWRCWRRFFFKRRWRRWRRRECEREWQQHGAGSAMTTAVGGNGGDGAGLVITEARGLP